MTKSGVHSSSVGLRVRGIRRPFFGEVVDHRETLPGKPGTVLYPQPPGDKVIEVDFALAHSPDLPGRRATARQIAAFLFSTAEVPIEFDDEPDVVYTGKVSDAPTPDELAVLDKFTVTLTVHPYAVAKADTAAAGSVAPETPLVFQNDGTADTDTGTLTLTFSAAAASFSAGINGDVFTYNSQIAAGDVFAIDLNTFDATLTSGSAVLSVSHLISGTVPLIASGENELTIAGAATVAASVVYRKCYL